ncbi:MAG: SPFH domain-containing protein [Dissulfurispiraceae bacterium]|jgi:regulator of protease activity HflC (stomatin/prohibitin superfamily)
MESILHFIGVLSVGGLLIGILALISAYQSVVIVGGKEIALIERRWLGKKMPQGRVVAMNGEVGIQARTLGPGMHFLFPFIYTAKKSEFVEIMDGKVGLIESVDGGPIPPGKIFAKVIQGHNSFQDGEAFLQNGGQKGPQIDILPPGKYRINPYLFKVSIANAVVIEKGQVGVVTSQDGNPIASGRLLAASVPDHHNFEDGEKFLTNGGQKGPQLDILLPGTYRINLHLFQVATEPAAVIESAKVGLVTAKDGDPLPEKEYVAKSVAGHSDFQDANAFLKGGGQRGPQLDVLKPGTYYINPLMFNVAFDDVAVVERGQVAVVVSNVGEEPTADMKKRLGSTQMGATEEEGKEKYVVPKGYRGIQEEVAGPGKYYLNRLAFMPYIIDTTNITIDWDDSKETRFDPLSVISKDGFPIGVSVKVVVRVRPDQAPYMVAKVGSIDNLILHVIHPMIDSSFRNQASTTSAMNFMQDRQEEQTKAETRARMELEKYHVECVSVLICQIKLPQELMDTQTKKIIAQQQTEQYTEQQKAEVTRIEMEKTKATADQQPELVRAEIAVKVADQKKRETVTLAEGNAESARLKGEGDAKAIESIGTATAEAYEKQKTAIGPQAIMAIELAKHIATGKIKIMPDILTIGSGGASEGLATVLTQAIALSGMKIDASKAAVKQTTDS